MPSERGGAKHLTRHLFVIVKLGYIFLGKPDERAGRQREGEGTRRRTGGPGRPSTKGVAGTAYTGRVPDIVRERWRERMVAIGGRLRMCCNPPQRRRPGRLGFQTVAGGDANGDPG